MRAIEPNGPHAMPMESQEVRKRPAPLAGRVPVGASPAQIAACVGVLWLDIDTALHPIIGHRGVAALFHRSLTLTANTHSWLAAGHGGLLANIDTAALQVALAAQNAAEAAAGADALLLVFNDLLTSLVGPLLTDRLLLPVWAHPSAAAPVQDPKP